VRYLRVKKQQSFHVTRVFLVAFFALSVLLLLFFVFHLFRVKSLEGRVANLEKHQAALEMEISAVTGVQRTMSINLYYYNELLDRLMNDEVICDTGAVIPVQRTIPYSQSPINDALRLLLRGELTKAEEDLGFKTEFPGRELQFLGARLENGVLFLKFSDPAGFTSGGSCRVNLLKAQIEKTALQFDSVSSVEFEPIDLFQP